MPNFTRRDFLTGTAAALACSCVTAGAAPNPDEPIIDIHQHTDYSGRTNEQLLIHQRAMGVTTTILLPAGRPMNLDSTHKGKSNGLAAEASGNEAVMAMARANPKEYLFFVNEVPDIPEAQKELEKYLKLGAKGIGEQKFNVDCDSVHMQKIAEVAQEFDVPVLMHFQHETYNKGIERFYKMLEKFPKVNFIGHAQTWWGNIDKEHVQTVLYPMGKVTPGGITDRYLTDYPNMYADMSAGSGLGAFLRDEEHTKAFFTRHQNKLLFGTDCNDTISRGPGCQGSRTIAAIRRLAPSKEIERKIFYGNSKRLFKL
ncbi:MAG: amidohydrolase 2 [Verrucomicrobia bacterium]|nr:amidohydrolase 2 [Verrucomicrobiota bacterium]